MSQINYYLPAGITLHTAGFPNCSQATLQNMGPAGCPKGSGASAIGNALGEVTFGSERVAEEAELRAFLQPGGMLFYMAGHSPLQLEVIWSGHWVIPHQAPYGEELQAQLPRIESVPGAPLASLKTIHIKLGDAFKAPKAPLVSYFNLANVTKQQCETEGSLRVKTEVTFGGQYGGQREFGIPPKTVTVVSIAACPR